MLRWNTFPMDCPWVGFTFSLSTVSKVQRLKLLKSTYLLVQWSAKFGCDTGHRNEVSYTKPKSITDADGGLYNNAEGTSGESLYNSLRSLIWEWNLLKIWNVNPWTNAVLSHSHSWLSSSSQYFSFLSDETTLTTCTFHNPRTRRN